MNEPHDPNRTVDGPSAPADSLHAGLTAGSTSRPYPVLRETSGAPLGQPFSSIATFRRALL
jgi:hypothetical protein